MVYKTINEDLILVRSVLYLRNAMGEQACFLLVHDVLVKIALLLKWDPVMRSKDAWK
jgi:hypothetical protein